MLKVFVETLRGLDDRIGVIAEQTVVSGMCVCAQTGLHSSDAYITLIVSGREASLDSTAAPHVCAHTHTTIQTHARTPERTHTLQVNQVFKFNYHQLSCAFDSGTDVRRPNTIITIIGIYLYNIPQTERAFVPTPACAGT